MKKIKILTDVNSDQQQGGRETNVTIDRDTVVRLGLTLSAIDNTLYDAFGQRQVSTIYNALNQYHVVMEVAPRYWQNPRRSTISRSRLPAPIHRARSKSDSAGTYSPP